MKESCHEDGRGRGGHPGKRKKVERKNSISEGIPSDSFLMTVLPPFPSEKMIRSIKFVYAETFPKIGLSNLVQYCWPTAAIHRRTQLIRSEYKSGKFISKWTNSQKGILGDMHHIRSTYIRFITSVYENNLFSVKQIFIGLTRASLLYSSMQFLFATWNIIKEVWFFEKKTPEISQKKRYPSSGRLQLTVTNRMTWRNRELKDGSGATVYTVYSLYLWLRDLLGLSGPCKPRPMRPFEVNGPQTKQVVSLCENPKKLIS